MRIPRSKWSRGGSNSRPLECDSFPFLPIARVENSGDAKKSPRRSTYRTSVVSTSRDAAKVGRLEPGLATVPADQLCVRVAHLVSNLAFTDSLVKRPHAETVAKTVRGLSRRDASDSSKRAEQLAERSAIPGTATRVEKQMVSLGVGPVLCLFAAARPLVGRPAPFDDAEKTNEPGIEAESALLTARVGLVPVENDDAFAVDRVNVLTQCVPHFASAAAGTPEEIHGTAQRGSCRTTAPASPIPGRVHQELVFIGADRLTRLRTNPQLFRPFVWAVGNQAPRIGKPVESADHRIQSVQPCRVGTPRRPIQQPAREVVRRALLEMPVAECLREVSAVTVDQAGIIGIESPAFRSELNRVEIDGDESANGEFSWHGLASVFTRQEAAARIGSRAVFVGRHARLALGEDAPESFQRNCLVAPVNGYEAGARGFTAVAENLFRFVRNAFAPEWSFVLEAKSFQGGNCMLVLSRKAGETIRIGDDVVLTLVAIDGSRVRLGIEAPPDVRILRNELVACDAANGEERSDER